MTYFHHLESRKSLLYVVRLIMILNAIILIQSFSFAGEVTADVEMKKAISAADCLECHDDAVNLGTYIKSVHGNNSCTSCHVDIVNLENHSDGTYEARTVNCASCHQKISEQYKKSVHKTSEEFLCVVCHHSPHEITKWNGHKKAIVNKCTECHEQDVFSDKGHSAKVLQGNDDAAACNDCHGLHNTRQIHKNKNKDTAGARTFNNSICTKCHGNKELAERNNLSTTVVDTYNNTYHGKIQKLGYKTHVAGCADCHTNHNILSKENPESTLYEDNLVANCGRCHSYANTNLIKFKPHADYMDHKANPMLFGIAIFMTILLVSVFLVFWLHTFLWWRKTYFKVQQLRKKGHVISPKILKMDNPGEFYTRFRIGYRVMHVLLIIVFLGLVITGIPLKFTSAPWSNGLIKLLGGPLGAGLIHRIMASVLILLFIVALIISKRFLFNKKSGGTFWQRLFSPDSLFFRKKDWQDFVGMLKWFVNKGPMPKFDRWTYWEKFDFLAVFWGMAAIGLSGLALWFPAITPKIFPGWIFNVAIIVHSDEAMLAAGFIFTVHFFNTHFIPTKFPMDTVIFTGRLEKYKFLEEKPLYFDRLAKEGKLERVKAESPDILTSILSSGFGILAILAGIVAMVLIVIGLFA